MARIREPKLRKVMEVALANTEKSNELMDAILELQAKFDAVLEKLDADTGVTSTDYSDELSLTKQIRD